MSKKSNYRDESWLRKQYVEKQLIASKIADICNCSKKTIYRWLRRHGIDTRDGGSLAERKAADSRLTDCEWLREQYDTQGKSSREIAQEIGCSKGAVQNWLEKHGIPTDGQRNDIIEPLSNKQWLRREYVDKGKSGYEIAKACGCSTTSVYKWIREHGIERQYNGKVCGEEHWWYSGGSKPYGRGWNRRKKRSVRSRDGYKCQDPACSVTQDEHLDQYGQKLHVHHLRKARDVEDANERNAKENLITLCRDCHKEWEKIADAGLVPELARL